MATSKIFVNQTVEIVMNTDYSPVIEALIAGGKGSLVGIAIIPAIMIFLCLLGFTCLGVAAASLAALRQSCIGDVLAGSCFSFCQFMAMSPLLFCKFIPIFGLIGFVVGITWHLIDMYWI